MTLFGNKRSDMVPGGTADAAEWLQSVRSTLIAMRWAFESAVPIRGAALRTIPRMRRIPHHPRRVLVMATVPALRPTARLFARMRNKTVANTKTHEKCFDSKFESKYAFAYAFTYTTTFPFKDVVL